jgi:hypothetical protein
MLHALELIEPGALDLFEQTAADRLERARRRHAAGPDPQPGPALPGEPLAPRPAHAPARMKLTPREAPDPCDLCRIAEEISRKG